MGQGYSLTTLSAGSASIDVPELSDLSYEKSLGDARFMKAIRARHRDGLVLAKVVMKPYASMKLEHYIKHILRERKLLVDIPNALGYHRAFETSSSGYLVRQYIFSSIYDRMSTRPFLEDIEKRWLAFQLLCAVRDCHSRGVYHGDIKTENTLVTSWNWLYLSDFSSSFKPTFLPEDNPADFSFYFDISGRRTCYLAPERFLRPGEKADGLGSITWAMDIFSVGCVIAELFLESPIFNLSQLFNYRRNEYDPEQTLLTRLEDKDVRELISHMIQLEPESRYSADEYLNFWKGKMFPEYFYNFLHQYMSLITDPSSGRAAITAGSANLGESDDRIDRVYFDFDKISYFLGYSEELAEQPQSDPNPRLDRIFPLHLDLPNKRQFVSMNATPAADDGTLLFLGIVTSALRSTARSTARIRAFELLLAFAERLTDEAKLDRVLPFVVSMLQDQSEIIKVAALRTLTQLVAMVSTTSPLNGYLFPEYILPRLELFTPLAGRKPSPLVRATYASCLATLAETASRFLDVVQALKSEGALSSAAPQAENGVYAHDYQDIYDVSRADIVKFFESQTKALLTDPDTEVRRAFLGSVSSLCVFFGSAKANDVILSHLNTYLNDKDWRLKCAFFETIVGVAVYVGGNSLEEFILPLMVQALTDPEEAVVEKVLKSLATMAGLGLFQRSKTWELVDFVARFTMHPNLWIREATAHFLASATRYITVADCQCIMRPLLEPYLRIFPTSFSETVLLDSLKRPLARSVLDMASLWASKVEKGIFWKGIQAQMALHLMEDRIPVAPSIDLSANALAKIQKNDEDQQWLGRLRNAGLGHDDEFKLLALREYIWRMAQRRRKEDIESSSSKFRDVVPVASLKIDLETVFFDRRPQTLDYPLVQENEEGTAQTQTITDALLDASTTVNRPIDSRDSSVSSGARLKVPERSVAASLNSTAPKVSSPLSSSPAARVESLNPLMEGLGDQELNTQTPNPILGRDNSLLSSTNGPGLVRHHHNLERKGSAMDLMRRKPSSSKAIAETSTSAANAIGKNDGIYMQNSASPTPPSLDSNEKRASPAQKKYEAAHTYRGRDPNVLKLLDTISPEINAGEIVEFGPAVTPVARWVAEKKADNPPSGRWRPTRTLVASFGEHTGPVNRVLPSPDHIFFITGSGDGSVKVWDCARLERNLAHRARQTYKHGQGAKITALCFIENTHCFVSAASNGSVHIVKVDSSETSDNVTKYGKLKQLRQWQLPDATSHAVWMEHYKAEHHSVLILATNKSQILALDLKDMGVLYTLDNPLQHGVPSCFCLDPQRHWLLIGTIHGVLDLWDLRFHLHIRSWTYKEPAPVHRILPHPAPPEKARENNEQGPRRLMKLVCVAGGTATGSGEVTILDLEKAACVAVYRVGCASTSYSKHTQQPTLAEPDSKKYTLVEQSNLQASSHMLDRLPSSLPVDQQDSSKPDRGVRALAVGNLSFMANGGPSDPFFVAAGPDASVRCWDLQRIANSRVVSGPEAGDTESWEKSQAETKDRVQFVRTESSLPIPIYEERIKTSGTEKAFTLPSSSNTSQLATQSRGKTDVGAKRASTASSSISSEPRSRKKEGQDETREAAPRSRTTMISDQQQKLLRSHLDSVLDVAILEYPSRMIVSVDRAGVMFVFS